MSKLLCHCGQVIRDQTENLPYKAEFIADQDYYEAFVEWIVSYVIRLMEAREAGQQDEFIFGDFPRTMYPAEHVVASHLSDVITARWITLDHDLYECEHCGRLWVQVNPDANQFVSYVPESDMRGVLRPQRNGEDNQESES